MLTSISHARDVAGGNGYLRTKQASEYLSVSPRTIRQWTAHRILSAYRPTKRMVLFRKTDLDAAMERFRTGRIGGAT